jgi:hypothetical protein
MGQTGSGRKKLYSHRIIRLVELRQVASFSRRTPNKLMDAILAGQ